MIGSRVESGRVDEIGESRKKRKGGKVGLKRESRRVWSGMLHQRSNVNVENGSSRGLAVVGEYGLREGVVCEEEEHERERRRPKVVGVQSSNPSRGRSTVFSCVFSFEFSCDRVVLRRGCVRGKGFDGAKDSNARKN